MGKGPLNISIGKSWKETTKWLNKLDNADFDKIIHEQAQRGLQALMDNTPVDTGLTRDSWSYNIEKSEGELKIVYTNSNTDEWENPIVLLLVYGHPTRNGGYVIGRDFVSPAIQSVFDDITKLCWKEVN